MTTPSVPSAFSLTIPNFQVVWDSTSLGWIKTCPAYYKFQMIDHWTLKTKGVHLMFGQLYASGVEHYAKQRAAGRSHDEATRDMVRFVLNLAGVRDAEGNWHPWEPPADHPDASAKNRYTLIRSLVWNVEAQLGSPFQVLTLANGKAAVELSFEFPAFEMDGESIHLAGHMDSIVENKADKTTWVLDDKTTKSALSYQYWQRYTPDNQMSLYSIAGKIVLGKPVSGVLVRAAQILVENTRFETRPVTRSPQILDEWMDDTRYWVGQALSFAKANYWPRNDKACNQYGGCIFQRVCERIPAHRNAWLREDYVQFEWNPAQSRGD